MELLPFTALGHVTAEDSWGDSWMKSRYAADVGSWNYFLNSWSESDHTWIDSRMSTAEATGWLRELLEPHVGGDRASSLTVHGLKATLLSWAAKSTIFTADEHLALGHHVNAQYRSAMIYSRDNQIGLCKKALTQMRPGSVVCSSWLLRQLLREMEAAVTAAPVIQRMHPLWPRQMESTQAWVRRPRTDAWRLTTLKLTNV